MTEKAESASSANNTSDSEGNKHVEDGCEFPEGGQNAWLVVFGAWCGLFAALGITNSIAVFQAHISTNQLSKYNEGTIGWIFSLYTFLSFFCGVYIGPIFDKFGPRWLVVVGTISITASQILLSWCKEFWHFILVFGCLNGFGCSLLFTPCLAAVGHYFRQRRGLATGIASSGGSIGGIIFPIMLQKLIASLGWEWAVRILGFTCLGLLLLANILVRSRLSRVRTASVHPNFSIFRERPFLLLTIAVFLMEFALFIPLGYISMYALSKGFSSDFSFYILTIMNVGSFFGRALPGWWSDRFGPFNSNILSVLLSLVGCLGVWLPFGGNKAGLIVFALLIGFSSGNNISITPVCIGRLCQTRNYGRYYATCFTVVGFACLLGIPIGGNIVNACGGDYWGLIVLTSAMYAASLVAFIFARGTLVGYTFRKVC